MIKCIHDQCRWPECDKTCGLVPTGDYVAGSCAEEGLIAHLQEEIERLHGAFREQKLYLQNARFSCMELSKRLNYAHEVLFDSVNGYVPTCPHGYSDCVCDPAYIRRYHPDWWKDLGMPTSCENCPNGEGYDDEDK